MPLINLAEHKLYRIGVDVGGTNTDAALACWTKPTAVPDGGAHPDGHEDISIVASHKSQTTADVTTGIRHAIQAVLGAASVPRDAVISVNIGTTHFINAVVQADASSLSRVAVLRLCGPFCREVPPFADFPPALRRIVEGYTAYVDGGLEIDGRPIKPVREEEIVKHATKMREAGVSVVVVVGVFSAVDTAEVTQEEQVKAILQREIPGVDVVCSRDIGRVGFIERENASVLNASILRFARRTIRGFERALAELRLDCPLYLTQNDGTIMDAEAACRTPIKTFSSGATNSLTGAVFLAGIHRKDSEFDLKTSQVIMVDVGGTTSDFAALSPSGFPRQSSTTASIAGVRTAFSMPELVSIGLGGGSLVTVDEAGDVSVGPTSVGHRLQTEALCFGGATATATDVVLARGFRDQSLPDWQGDMSSDVVSKASRQITLKLQRCVDTMKTSDLDVVLLLVGGGSIIQIDELSNVQKSIQPPFYKVANAVGAAIAKVAGEVDRIVIPDGRKHEQLVEELSREAEQLAYSNGARTGSVEIMELDFIPLQYVTNNAFRAVVKAVGELDWQLPSKKAPRSEEKAGTVSVTELSLTDGPESPSKQPAPLPPTDAPAPDLENYEPDVSKATREWYISEVDLDFIGEGCGILGTGGGGSVYSALLHSRETLRSPTIGGRRMRVVEAASLPPAAASSTSGGGTAVIAFVGAPSVSNERLIGGGEIEAAARALSRYLGTTGGGGYDAVMAAEVGGSNGMRAFAAAASLDVPVVDADMIGRAFPKIDMSLPYVYGQAGPAPAVLSDARGNVQVVAEVEDSSRFESIARSACIELGLYTALSLAPLGREVLLRYCCLGSISFAWFMGREICLARQRKADVVQALLSVIPGGRLLYKGKVVDVQREVKGGWTIGTTALEPFHDDDSDDDRNGVVDSRRLVLSYQNEFFCATLEPNTVLCTTPDLITVLDLSTGAALATHELRYGLRVAVIAMPAHPLWTTDVGLKMAGPEAFGISSPFQPLGTTWEKPPSVFDRYAK